MPAADIPLSEHLDAIPPAMRAIVRVARRMVKALAPKATEVSYRSEPPRSSRTMWKLVRYAIDDEPVVAIGTFPKHVSLFFFRGRELDEGNGLLQGGGKQFRFITLRVPADAERPAVKRIVRKAFALERARKRDDARR